MRIKKPQNHKDMKLLKKLYAIHSKSGREKNMKRFIDMYVKQNLPSCSIREDEKGNIYITKGLSENYPCIVAHLDQVQETHSKDFRAVETDGIIFGFSQLNRRQEGLGADDKNGIWIALRCLRRYDTLKVAFFVEEEVGCLGSSNADMDFFQDTRFVIEPDRRGRGDLITSIGGMELCSTEFLQATHYEQFGYKEADGLMTDIDALKDNGLSVSCINLSCGYYCPHTSTEFTVVHDLLNCKALVEHIIENCTDVYTHTSPFYGRNCSYADCVEDYYSDIYDLLANNPTMNFEEFYWGYGYYFSDMTKQEMKDFFDEVRDDIKEIDEEERKSDNKRTKAF